MYNRSKEILRWQNRNFSSYFSLASYRFAVWQGDLS